MNYCYKLTRKINAVVAQQPVKRTTTYSLLIKINKILFFLQHFIETVQDVHKSSLKPKKFPKNGYQCAANLYLLKYLCKKTHCYRQVPNSNEESTTFQQYRYIIVKLSEVLLTTNVHWKNGGRALPGTDDVQG